MTTRGPEPNMPRLEIDLPPYCVPKPRKGGFLVVYFQVPGRLRPKGWPDKTPRCPVRIDPANLAETVAKVCAWGQRQNDELARMRAGDPAPRRNPVKERGTLPWLANEYTKDDNPDWAALEPRTQSDYLKDIAIILKWSGASKRPHPPVTEIERKNVIAFLATMKDTPTKRRKVRGTLRLLFQHAVDLGTLDVNPADKIVLKVAKKVRQDKRRAKRERVLEWVAALDKIIAKADEMGLHSVGTAVLIASELAQRKSDVLDRRKGEHYQDGVFRFYQNKTGARVTVPAPKRLRERIEAYCEGQIYLVVNEATGQPYVSAEQFDNAFKRVAAEAGHPGLWFSNLRHLGILNLKHAGIDILEIPPISGHSLAGIYKILEEYNIEDDETAARVIAKLDAHRARQEQKLDR